jgi:hypothetical protein
MIGMLDQWLPLAELARMFGLSEEAIKRLAKTFGFLLRGRYPTRPRECSSPRWCTTCKPSPMGGSRFAAKRANFDSSEDKRVDLTWNPQISA